MKIMSLDCPGPFSSLEFNQLHCRNPKYGGGMRRREFIGLLGGSAIAWPHVARAQQAASSLGMPRIGILWADGYKANFRPGLGDILIETLARLGYVDGKTAPIIQRL